jgi:acetoin utilization deacetylase AcuC-like enzyme
MLCSTFQHPYYPHRGADSASDRMINIPLPAKSNGETFKQVFKTKFQPALEAFQPEIIYISAGFDAHINDPLANLALTAKDYIWMTQFIKKIAKKYCKSRIISSLEGGYHLPSLQGAALAHITALTK